MNSIKEELSVFDSIKFIESDHIYLIEGELTKRPSVTKLIKQYKRKFEKESAAARVAKRRGVTAEQIKAEWDMASLYSTTLGSLLHKHIEKFYIRCSEPTSFDFDKLTEEKKNLLLETYPKLVKHFKEFQKDNFEYVPVKNEFVVGDIKDTMVCGMLDMLAYNPKTESLEIWDFKTNKKIEHSQYGKLLFPFDDMWEGEINEYTIQLNVYKYFIEKYTNLKINKTKVIWFNANNDSYQVFELQSIQPKIEQMLKHFKINSLFQEEHYRNNI